MEKIESLSDESAALVISLIDDLAALEAKENAEDLAAAREALARIAAGDQPISWESLKAELDDIHSLC